MATKNSLFVDTSGWAYLVDRHNPLHQEMRAENHPFIKIFDNDSPSLDFKITYSYFLTEPLKSEAQGTYADPNAHLVHTTEYGWNHSLSEIINALISAGLKIEFLHEFPFCEWAYFPDMEEGEDRMFRFKDEQLKNMLPLTFSIKATKE
jgi:hypothetical protein